MALWWIGAKAWLYKWWKWLLAGFLGAVWLGFKLANALTPKTVKPDETGLAKKVIKAQVKYRQEVAAIEAEAQARKSEIAEAKAITDEATRLQRLADIANQRRR